MIEVAAGIITDLQGRVLLMQRLPGKHLAGLWEFPGGKLEPGESIERALIRELDEELGIEVLATKPLISLPWRYPEKSVRLHALRVTAWRGKPHAREGHPLCWMALRDMDVAAMPPADAPIVAALRLPAYYAIVDSGVLPVRDFVSRNGLPPHPGPLPQAQLGGEGEERVCEARFACHPLPQAVSRQGEELHACASSPAFPLLPHAPNGGEGEERVCEARFACHPLPQAVSRQGEELHARASSSAFPPSPNGGEGRGEGAGVPTVLWQLRMPDAPREEVRRVARAWLGADPSLREHLLVNHDIELARELRAGVHLKAAQLRELRERPLSQDAWVAASCHGAEELELAARLGVDFATLSPVRATASHPDAMPLGWECFAQCVAEARLPVYALGGVGPDDLERARAAGGQGVAGIRAFR